MKPTVEGVSDAIETLIAEFARHSPGSCDAVLLVDSTARSPETVSAAPPQLNDTLATPRTRKTSPAGDHTSPRSAAVAPALNHRLGLPSRPSSTSPDPMKLPIEPSGLEDAAESHRRHAKRQDA